MPFPSRTCTAIVVAVLAAGTLQAWPGQTICPSILQPVCARNSTGAQSFSNQCLAERAGYVVLSQGNCDGGGLSRIRVCSKEYLPVCGELDGMAKTFGNACEATQAGFEIVAESAC